MVEHIRTNKEFVTEDKDVTGLLRIIYKHIPVNAECTVVNPEWENDPDKWVVHFKASMQEYTDIISDIKTVGEIDIPLYKIKKFGREIYDTYLLVILN